MSSRTRWLFGLAALALAIVLVQVLPRQSGPAPEEEAAPADLASMAIEPRAFAVDAPGQPATAEARAYAIARGHEAMQHYLEFAVYPPWSRPADGSQDHLIHWNEPMDVGQAFALDDQQGPISADVEIEPMFAAPGEAITATVRVWSGPHEERVGPPVAFQAWGEVHAPTPDEENPETVRDTASLLRFEIDQPGSDPNSRTARFVPSTVAELAASPRIATLVVWVEAGDRKFPFQLQFRYAAHPPLVVVDKQADRIVDGSLEVDVLVDVAWPQPTVVQAALFDGQGAQPIAIYDGAHRPEQAGRQTMTLKFFGKAIRDKGLNGPYTIRALHGVTSVDDGARLVDVFWKHDGVLQTSRYAADDFSAEEWRSPEKDAKVAQYEEFIRGLERGSN